VCGPGSADERSSVRAFCISVTTPASSPSPAEK
jgi:hypothetical protein